MKLKNFIKQYQRFLINVEFFLKNIFKYKHGYAKYCDRDKQHRCPVCSTKWPDEILIKNNIKEYEPVFFEKIIGTESCKIYGNFYGGNLYLPKATSLDKIYKKNKIN